MSRDYEAAALKGLDLTPFLSLPVGNASAYQLVVLSGIGNAILAVAQELRLTREERRLDRH